MAKRHGHSSTFRLSNLSSSAQVDGPTFTFSQKASPTEFQSLYSAPESAYDKQNVFGTHKGGDPTSVDAAGDDAQIPHLDVPLTPKSEPPDSEAETKTPRSAVTALTSHMYAKNSSTAKDMEAVGDLLHIMKQTLGALGATFDTLGDQTMKIAALGPAIDANHQISIVRRQLDDQHKRQEQRMLEVKAMLKDELMDRNLEDQLRGLAASIVREVVRKEIEQRVRKELQEQITQGMRDQVAQYQRQLLEVKTSLYNSEARRHNALIRTNTLDEPLRPLLRPLDSSLPSSDNTAVASPNSASTSKDGLLQRTLASLDTEATSRPLLNKLVMDLIPPTPSPLFPRSLTSLMKLGSDEAQLLMKDYGLVTNSQLSGSSPTAPPTGAREEALNRFMSHIGVGFQLVPAVAPAIKSNTLETVQSPTSLVTVSS